MTSILQLLHNIANSIDDLRKDVTGIQRTLVRMEAGTMLPPCNTRRRSASRATQTWTGQQGSSNNSTQNQPAQQYQSNNAMQNRPGQQLPSNFSTPNWNQRFSSTRGRNRAVPYQPSRAIQSTSASNQRVAGPAEVRLSNMRQVLMQAANAPVDKICMNHKRFNGAADVRQCPS